MTQNQTDATAAIVRAAIVRANPKLNISKKVVEVFAELAGALVLIADGSEPVGPRSGWVIDCLASHGIGKGPG